MRDTVTYEWTLEMCDEHNDIFDLEHHDDFQSALENVEKLWGLTTEPDPVVFRGYGRTPYTVHHVDFCLVKRWGNDCDGETDRGYAYITRNDDGSLTIEKEFSNGESVNKSHRRLVEG